MSNVNQLRNMWQSRSRQQANSIPVKSTPPPKPTQPQRQTTITSIKSQPIPIPTIPEVKKTQSIQQKIGHKDEHELSRQSVAQIRKNLENKLGPIGIMGMSRPAQSAYMYPPKKVQTTVQGTRQEKKLAEELKQLHVNQRMPTFLESRAQLQNMFQKKKTEPQQQGYHTGAPNQNAPGFINLSANSTNSQNLTPEQRTQQVMKRIFSAPEAPLQSPTLPAMNSTKSQKIPPKSDPSKQQQQVTSLVLRQAKKQKMDLGNFDDF